MLGMNRNTLRAKLAKYDIADGPRRRRGRLARGTAHSRPRHARSHHPSAALGLRQDRPRRIRARARARSACACCPPAAPRRRSPTPGSPVTESATTPAFPEMLDGRVKTLHPKVHGGILARRDLPAHAAALARARHSDRSISSSSTCIRSARRSRKPGCTLDDAIENIDIGGPTMVRAAAKNWPHVGVVVDPADYAALLAELARGGGALSRRDALRARAQGVLAHRVLRRRDHQLADRARRRRRGGGVSRLASTSQAVKVQDLRYGENPHQQAAFYRDETPAPGTHRHVPPAAGQGAVVQQHRRQRRRVGMREDVRASAGLRDRQARESLRRRDRRRRRSTPTARRSRPIPTSAFGGIIAFNRPVDAATRRGGVGAVPRGADRARRTPPTRSR